MDLRCVIIANRSADGCIDGYLTLGAGQITALEPPARKRKPEGVGVMGLDHI